MTMIGYDAAPKRAQMEMKYLDEQLSALVGCKIVGVQIEYNDGDGLGEAWPVLVLERHGRTWALVVQRDPEGNGPGHLDLQALEVSR